MTLMRDFIYLTCLPRTGLHRSLLPGSFHLYNLQVTASNVRPPSLHPLEATGYCSLPKTLVLSGGGEKSVTGFTAGRGPSFPREAGRVADTLLPTNKEITDYPIGSILVFSIKLINDLLWRQDTLNC